MKSQSTRPQTPNATASAVSQLLGWPSGSLVLLSNDDGALKATLVSKPTMVTSDVSKTVEALAPSFTGAPGAILWPGRVSEELNAVREENGKGRVLVRVF